MINRSNLRLLIAVFSIAAAGAWCFGYLKYSQPDHYELFCRQQFLNFYHDAQANTNLHAIQADTLKVSENAGAVGSHMTLDVYHQQQWETDSYEIWNQNELAEAAKRHQAWSDYNHIPEILGGMFAVLLLFYFVTAPTPRA